MARFMLLHGVMRESHDVILVLSSFSNSVSRHLAVLSRLDGVVSDHLLGAEGYLDPAADKGLLVLRFSGLSWQLLGADTIREMVECDLPILAMERLSESERRAFYREYLRRYSVYLQQYPSQDDDYPLLVRTLMGLVAHTNPPPIGTGEETLDVEETDILGETASGRPASRRWRMQTAC